ncbi:MAG: FAD-binding oxidoreductase, partial [Gammaproteobacteria bacterium]|nr:FAD-binding oxidoreductase [Gammaproteobacteria bacterium]
MASCAALRTAGKLRASISLMATRIFLRACIEAPRGRADIGISVKARCRERIRTFAYDWLSGRGFPMSAQPNQADAAVGVAAAVFAAFETDEVVLDLEERRAQSSDVYSLGVTAAAVLRPRSKSRCAEMVAAANQAGLAVIGRGGGLSYTGGYLPVHEQAVILDTSLLDRIVEVNADDMYITVEAGVTWKRIYDTLAPLGLRLPFFGTFSGAQATVGGGLSNGALFLGTARHGTGADHVLGLEVVLADGSLLAT